MKLVWKTDYLKTGTHTTRNTIESPTDGTPRHTIHQMLTTMSRQNIPTRSGDPWFIPKDISHYN